MIIHIGTNNPLKVQTVKETLAGYTMFKNAQIQGISVSQPFDQPINLMQTLQGAKGRAEACFSPDSKLSIGLECGLMELDKQEWMHVSICSVFDGSNHHIGQSPGFRLPQPIVEMLLHENMNLNQAANSFGLSGNTQLGKSEGTIGILTKCRINRADLIKQSIITALVSIEHPQWFSKKQIDLSLRK